MLGVTKLVRSPFCFSQTRVILFSSELLRNSLLTNFSTDEKEVNISIRGKRKSGPTVHAYIFTNRCHQIKVISSSEVGGNKTKEINC